MRLQGKQQYLPFLAATLFPLLCLPSLLPAETEPPLRLLKPEGTGGAPSPGAAAGPVSNSTPLAFHDIHGPIQIAEPVSWLVYGLAALLVLCLLAGLWWWFRKRQQAAPPAIPAGVTARSELMAARELMTPELQLKYMERASAVLRRYLEQRFQLPTTRQTTQEFFTSIRRSRRKYSELTRYSAELKSCLEQCDMAKFAHRTATIESLQDLENGILRFINRTEQPASEPWQTEAEGMRA